jgi:hypothetical protein
MVPRDGIELQGGVDTTQVIDFTFGEKGQKGYFAGSAVQNWYKIGFQSNHCSAPTQKYQTSLFCTTMSCLMYLGQNGSPGAGADL